MQRNLERISQKVQNLGWVLKKKKVEKGTKMTLWTEERGKQNQVEAAWGMFGE